VITYVLRRLLLMIPVAFLVTIGVFALVRLSPADPALAFAGEERDPAMLAAIRKEMGLDQPLYQQYLIYLGQLAQFDLGKSVINNRPVVEELARRQPQAAISIDTVKSGVARVALDAGAHIVNDVSALRLDPAIAKACAERGAGLVLMHSRGSVADMATFAHAEYRDVVAEVVAELGESVVIARKAGVQDQQIVLDPGVGFSKKSEHSLAILAGLRRLTNLGFPVLVGASRKRFIGEITGVGEPGLRLGGTLGASVAALALGAHIFRVHDVREHREALDVAWRIIRSGM